jgi:hypothetical protein
MLPDAAELESLYWAFLSVAGGAARWHRRCLHLGSIVDDRLNMGELSLTMPATAAS